MEVRQPMPVEMATQEPKKEVQFVPKEVPKFILQVAEMVVQVIPQVAVLVVKHVEERVKIQSRVSGMQAQKEVVGLRGGRGGPRREGVSAETTQFV